MSKYGSLCGFVWFGAYFYVVFIVSVCQHFGGFAVINFASLISVCK